MKKQLLMVALFVSLAAGTAGAEISTNLQVRKEFNGKGKPTLVTFVDDEGNPVTAENTGYAQVRYVYYSDKWVTRQTFLDTDGKPVNSLDGGYATVQKRYNSLGKVIEIRYVDVDGKDVCGPEGFAHQVSTYQGKTLLEMFNYDAEGKPVSTDRICAHYKAETVPSVRGRQYLLVVSETYFDQDGNEMNMPDGYSRAEYT